MPIWRNRENVFKDRYQKVEKCAENDILQKKRKKLGKFSWMYFTVFDGFRPILMVFIDQNMQIHDFSMIFCQKSMDSGPGFVHDFH